MKQAVVLVHGIWMPGFDMGVLRHRIKACGYEVRLFHYHSIIRCPHDNACRLNQYLKTINAETIHLVAHSLGGIVLLHLFQHWPAQKPGRVVLLGTPVAGSMTAKKTASHFVTRLFLGRSVEAGLLGDAPQWRNDRPLAMISGTRGIGVGTVLTQNKLNKPNDGTVALSETEMLASHHRITIRCGHLALLYRKQVALWVCEFLKTGSLHPTAPN